MSLTSGIGSGCSSKVLIVYMLQSDDIHAGLRPINCNFSQAELQSDNLEIPSKLIITAVQPMPHKILSSHRRR